MTSPGSRAAILQAQGAWNILTLADRQATPAAAELTRFVTTPRATQAMLRGTGVDRRPVQAVDPRHALELSRGDGSDKSASGPANEPED